MGETEDGEVGDSLPGKSGEGKTVPGYNNTACSAPAGEIDEIASQPGGYGRVP